MACVLPCQGPLCTSPFWVGSCLPHSLGTALAEPSRAAHLRSRVQATGAWVPTTWQAWLDPDLALGGRNTPVTPLALVSAQRGRFFKMGDRAGTAGVTGAVAHTALEVCQRCVTCPWCFIYSGAYEAGIIHGLWRPPGPERPPGPRAAAGRAGTPVLALSHPQARGPRPRSALCL